MTLVTTALTWLTMDWRRIAGLIAVPLIILALWAGFNAYVAAKVDAGVERARADWIADQRAAELAAAARADQSLAKATATNRAKQKELNNAAQKGDDSSVGPGLNAVLDGLSNDTNRSR